MKKLVIECMAGNDCANELSIGSAIFAQPPPLVPNRLQTKTKLHAASVAIRTACTWHGQSL